MRLIKTGAVLPFILLLLITINAGIPAGLVKNQSITILANTGLHAQEIQNPGFKINQDKEKRPEQSPALYQVMGVVLFIWIGLACFLFRLDRRVSKLENQVKINK